MEDNERQRKSTRGRDHFSKVMFGDRQPRGTSQSKDSSEPRTNRYDNWFFGRGKKQDEHKQQEQSFHDKVENIMNNVDLELLFDTYDTIVTTTEQYKPLFKEMAPFFSKFTDKFKK
ncbi:hypothetical protein COJ96_02660 [Bacillus sp. AFS073361]|uniref:hypothetical protein n=1 Tax=Bacillus sp. AFS073361 TaxID=2033511 RepID=UPI000BF2A762|nr:hypothetical protein [Bacillus sp. AFS073361]PFP30882.1 hypothetical protein COJ96_02660 [Bacillus sp. AFS073361]